MPPIADDPGHFARKPWFLSLFLLIAALAIAIDVVDGDNGKIIGTVAFMTGMFAMIMFRRTADKRFRLLAIGGFSVFLITAIVRVGTKLSWW